MEKVSNFKKAVVAISFIAVSILLIKKVFFIGLIGIIFFGSVLILIILIYFFPNSELIQNIYKTITGNKNENIKSKKNFMEIYNDNGIFEFSDKGFLVQTDKSIEDIKWNKIEFMLGYKEDLYATDLICLNVYYGNGTFKITEETPGWHQFLEYSKIAFPSIEKNWQIDISVPAFERKLTLVYDKQNRPLNEILEVLEKH